MPRYLVTTMRTANFQQSAIALHYVFLEQLREKGVLELAGPFTDKSGGAYLLTAASLEDARAMAFSDPVHTTGSSVVTVYEWNAQ
ncbi:YciI family protein [Glaciimonas soli]|uniref:YCII-related domain-containing protein n=1 Tax=Glaciimonas soli TaxID=2590999 RepID=A0A843YLG0_9BURK|nr:YciI family protein [Glaciimonas soli]MQR00265.1 hypothetical protein [Glaciimonas soli]